MQLFIFAFGLFLLTVGAALIMALIVTYHFWTYRVQGDQSLRIVTVFLAGAGVLLFGLTASFFSVPWNDLPGVVQGLGR